MIDKDFVTAKQSVTFEIPSIPNYILVYGGEKKPIADIDNETLKIIGEAWVKRLIKSAEEKRKTK